MMEHVFTLQPVPRHFPTDTPRAKELAELSRQELLLLLYDNCGGMYWGIRKSRLIQYILWQDECDEDIDD